MFFLGPIFSQAKHARTVFQTCSNFTTASALAGTLSIFRISSTSWTPNPWRLNRSWGSSNEATMVWSYSYWSSTWGWLRKSGSSQFLSSQTCCSSIMFDYHEIILSVIPYIYIYPWWTTSTISILAISWLTYDPWLSRFIHCSPLLTILLDQYYSLLTTMADHWFTFHCTRVQDPALDPFDISFRFNSWRRHSEHDDRGAPEGTWAPDKRMWKIERFTSVLMAVFNIWSGFTVFLLAFDLDATQGTLYLCSLPLFYCDLSRGIHDDDGDDEMHAGHPEHRWHRRAARAAPEPHRFRQCPDVRVPRVHAPESWRRVPNDHEGYEDDGYEGEEGEDEENEGVEDEATRYGRMASGAHWSSREVRRARLNCESESEAGWAWENKRKHDFRWCSWCSNKVQHAFKIVQVISKFHART